MSGIGSLALVNIPSSVTISGGGNTATVNPDGSINVNVISATSTVSLVAQNYYSEVSGVSSGVTQTVLSYSVPVGKIQNISSISASGTNIAVFAVYINTVLVAKKRTYFGDSLGVEFIFGSSGYSVSAGDLIEVKATSTRGIASDYEAELVYADVTSISSVKEYFNEISGAAAAVSNTILSYTAPAVTNIHLVSIDVSGDQIAQYDVELNSSTISRRRTYFGSSLNDVINFETTGTVGLKLLPGDTILVKATHSRATVGSFCCRLVVVEE